MSEIMEHMRRNNAIAFNIAKSLISQTKDKLTNGCPELGLRNHIMTQIEKVPAHHLEWLSVILN